MKEQIEEMADKLCTTSYFCSTEDWDSCNQADGEYCDRCRKLAERLYNAGYRKQSEGEWQTAPDGTHWCSECGHDATYTFDGTEICGVACPFCGAKMKGENNP